MMLIDEYDALLCDLDGTLFRGGTALPEAPELLAEAARRGVRIGYLTNNGSRNAAQVAAHLRKLGFPADQREVITSGQAAVRLLADRLRPGSAVLVVGTEALAGEVVAAGMVVVGKAEEADAVVQGHSPDTGWANLAEACLAIRAGALWVACNMDLTLPDERGELPGNGAMVAALQAATGQRPLVAGKPAVGLFTEAVRRAESSRPLVVGDRLDTDIAGANVAGLPSMLVLTGVSDGPAVLSAPASLRPEYLGADFAALRLDSARARVGGQPPWHVKRSGDELILSAESDADADPVDALRTLCAAHWADGEGPVPVRGADEASKHALSWLGFA